MNGNKLLLKEYIEKQKKLNKLGEEAAILMMNGIKNDRYKQLEREVSYINQEMDSISRRFIESFILD